MEAHDFHFRLKVDLVVLLSLEAVFGGLAILTHHDYRRLNSRQAR
jgi:hypothetical protein